MGRYLRRIRSAQMTREWCASRADEDAIPVKGPRPIDSRHDIKLQHKRSDRYKDHRR